MAQETRVRVFVGVKRIAAAAVCALFALSLTTNVALAMSVTCAALIDWQTRVASSVPWSWDLTGFGPGETILGSLLPGTAGSATFTLTRNPDAAFPVETFKVGKNPGDYPVIMFNDTTPFLLTLDALSQPEAAATIHLLCRPNAPAITSVTPNTDVTAGSQIQITGTNLLGVNAVLVNGALVSPSAVTDTSVTFTMPAGTAGSTVNVGVRRTITDVYSDSSNTLPITYRNPGMLSVAPGSGLAAAGPFGGPILPAMKSWTLSNIGGDDVVIRVTAAGGFFDIAGATAGGTFTLGAGETRQVTVTLNAAANALGAGSHSGSIEFTNITNGIGDAARPLSLTVSQAPTSVTLAITPAAPTVSGEPVTLAAQVTGGVSPGGNVEFRDSHNNLLASAALDGSGEARALLSDLAVGSHTITAHYLGDGNHAPSASVAATHDVARIATALTLSSSINPANAGEAVTFTARISPVPPAGAIIFSIDGADQPAAALTGDSASFTTSLLGVGDHQITARYDGGAVHAPSVSNTLTQSVLALGSVVIVQRTDGVDARFDFLSPTPALNLSIATSGGQGASPAISLPAGSYAIAARDMTAEGFALSDLVCSDANSTVDLAARTANIVLDVGEALVCTFTSTNVRARTVSQISAFFEARANIILAHQPSLQRRIDRLNGRVGIGSLGSVLMGYLPALANAGALSAAASLSQIEHLAGNEQPSQFDLWLEGTFGQFSHRGADGSFGLLSGGLDYLLSEDVLIGAFFQIDQLAQENAAISARAGGTGWLAGPYLTARLGENIYLDLLAAGGRAENHISPLGTYEDWYGSTRFLASATLQGNFTQGPWTFAPAASLSWFSETSDAYRDGLGITIPATSLERGEFAIGPGVRYQHDLGDSATMSSELRFDAVLAYRNSLLTPGQTDAHGRISGGLDFGFDGGATLGLSLSHDGLFGGATRSTAASVRLSLPLN